MMKSIGEVSQMILDGKVMVLAGSEKALMQLPKGNWIGGTIPYFMTDEGGSLLENKIQTTILPDEVTGFNIQMYDSNTISTLPQNYFPNGFTIIIMPALTAIHQHFAKDCSTWNGIFDQPLVGWISGAKIEKVYLSKPKVVDGRTGEFSDCLAISIHCELNSAFHAKANIINIFEQGTGDVLTFSTAGFDVTDVTVNGKTMPMSQYVTATNMDRTLPLVANYMGAYVNVSFRITGDDTNSVKFAAPVFPGIEYRQAKPIKNYENEFRKALAKHDVDNSFFACNCYLNYQYANLEGKIVGKKSTAMTFGEIAYMLLNQTYVYLTIEKKSATEN